MNIFLGDHRAGFRLAFFSFLGAFCFALSLPAAAAPRVIKGIYPRARAAYNTPGSNSPAPAPAYRAPAYRAPAYRTPEAAGNPDPYGGGLIEMLMTGHTRPAEPSPYASLPRKPMHDVSTLAYAKGVYAYAPGVYASPARTEPRPVDQGLNPIYRRQVVAYHGPQKPGTIVIDTEHKFLYFIEKGDKALRYGVGVGRPGFLWKGVTRISRKEKWPGWTPPADMLKRRPDLPRYMPGGPGNPLGARALYLGSSLYRIHGTNAPQTIGENMSSGCIRMMNSAVEDLYDRVSVGTKVVVM